MFVPSHNFFHLDTFECNFMKTVEMPKNFQWLGKKLTFHGQISVFKLVFEPLRPLIFHNYNINVVHSTIEYKDRSEYLQ